MTIDKKTLEKHVPAFVSPTEDLFVHISSFIAGVLEDLIIKVGDSWESFLDKPRFSSLAEKYVCCEAAYKAIPYLDIVATDTGFGVVSNQNVAPASAHRVNALRERLRVDKSVALDSLLDYLIKNSDWGSSDEAKATVQLLVWCPAVARRYGISFKGDKVYHEEFEDIQWDLLMTESYVKMYISNELYDALITRVRTNKLEGAYAAVLKASYAYIAAYMESDHPVLAFNSLLTILDEYADSLPEYKDSAAYRARHSELYKNKKDDGCFFFG